MEKLRTAKEIAEYLDVSIQRIYELCRTDASFPVIVIGQRQYRFSIDAITKWAESGGSQNQEHGPGYEVVVA
jgi:hypothetical protein